MKRLAAALPLLLLVFESARAEERPLLGLALGGGAARGIAHIGFLEWLEEHRIPVDRIAGTSMGGLVGGAYASGMSPAELRQLMRDTDWQLVFLPDSPFRHKNFRRKEDARSFPSTIELGLKGGLRLPAGMNAGQEVGMLLDRVSAPYGRLETFDELPIPFRSVATDLRGRGIVVLGSGSLSLAMRATMAIPGLFNPVELSELILVDGGTLNNVPADIVRAMGAEAVIAVNVSASTDEPEPPSNLFDVLGQTMDVMMASGVERALTEADVVVTPALRGLTGLDWLRSDEIADRGYEAAQTMSEELLPYAVSAEDYASWKSAREARRRRLPERLTAIRVEGVSSARTERVEAGLREKLLGQPLHLEMLEEEIDRLAGTDRYETVRYRLDRGETGATLVVIATPKRYGPPFLHPAVDIENIDSNSFAMTLRARLVFLDAFVPDSEMRFDAGVGSRQSASFELYRRLAGTPLFFAPRTYWSRDRLNGYDDEGQLVAEYAETRSGVGIDFGLSLGQRSELRFGYDVAGLEARRRVGEPTLPEADGSNRFASVRFAFDGQSSPLIPTRGLYARVWMRRYFASPAVVLTDSEIPGPADYAQAELRLWKFRSFSDHHRWFLGASGGTTFGEDAGYNVFRLGGPLRLGAFRPGEVQGDNYLLGLAGVLYRVMDLPDVFGGDGYLGSWLETGSAFGALETAKLKWQISGGLVLETFLGPIFAGGSVSLDSGQTRVYVNLGPFVR